MYTFIRDGIALWAVWGRQKLMNCNGNGIFDGTLIGATTLGMIYSKYLHLLLLRNSCLDQIV